MTQDDPGWWHCAGGSFRGPKALAGSMTCWLQSGCVGGFLEVLLNSNSGPTSRYHRQILEAESW